MCILSFSVRFVQIIALGWELEEWQDELQMISGGLRNSKANFRMLRLDSWLQSSVKKEIPGKEDNFMKKTKQPAFFSFVLLEILSISAGCLLSLK